MARILVYPFKSADTDEWTWVVGETVIIKIADHLPVIMDQGFYTDLGTVPWFARWMFNPADPQCAEAYVIHDFLLINFGPDHQLFAASQFYEVLRKNNVKKWKRIVMWLGITLGIDRW